MILPSRNSRNTAKKAFICPPRWNRSKGDSQRSDPLNLQRHSAVVFYFLLYLIHLPGHDLFAPFRPSRAAAKSRFLPRGVSKLGNSSKSTSGAKNLLSSAPAAPCSRACRYLRAISRLLAGSPIFASTNCGSPPSVQFVAPACPSLVSQPAHSFQFVRRLEDFCLAAAPDEFPNNLTSCSGFTRALSTVSPQCRCGPVTRPVAPTFPSTAPASNSSPTFTSISDRCP